MFLQAALETIADNPTLGLSGLAAALVLLWRVEQHRCNEDRQKLWQALEDNKKMVLSVIAKLGPPLDPSDDDPPDHRR